MDAHGGGGGGEFNAPAEPRGWTDAAGAAPSAWAGAAGAETPQQQQQQLRTLRELQEQNGRFVAAIDNMSLGLCLFDGAHRLIICNRPYAELYGLRYDDVRPGLTLREIVDMRYAAGTSPEMPAAGYVAWRDRIALEDKPSETVITLRNGRVMLIRHQPMPDGGWVSTHEDVTERRRAEARAVHLARNDALTGLSNRGVFLERLAQAASGLLPGRIVAVLCVDVDRFKEVNDALGHAAGDRLLQEVASRIRQETRESDLVARLGGDEFAVILGDVRDAGEAAVAADRIIGAASAPYCIEGHEAAVGLSVGIALGDAELLCDPEQLLRHAELALGSAKTDGGGMQRLFDSRMDRAQQVRKLRERELGEAIATGDLELHFQPQVGAGGQGIAGTEALVRWRSRSGRLVPPGEFIPLAEETGLILPLGEWVLRTACEQAKAWPGLTVAANLSALQLRRPGFAELLARILAETGFDPARLELEITESAILHDTEATIATLERIKALGVRISMDDFGTGYSSLSYLRRFAFDKLKIDRSFVRDLAQDGEKGEQARAIVQAIIGLSRTLGMRTVAEGVETAEQARMLAEDGCDELQGYLFGRPVDAAEFERTHLRRRPLEAAAAG